MIVLLIALFSVVLIASLGALCILNARAIRRDVKQRYKEIETRLEEEANKVVDDFFGDGTRA